MRILILNGNPDKENKNFEAYLEKYAERLIRENNDVEIIYLRDKKVIHCTGCWHCWVKTPGECSHPDDTIEIRKSIIKSNLVIFASPLIMGFISSIMKTVMDKMIPLLHPYIDIVNDETHHFGRYEHYPAIGLILENSNADYEEIEITRDIFKRFALNFKSELTFCETTESEIFETINEVNYH